MSSTLRSWTDADGTPTGTPNAAQTRGRQWPSKSTIDQAPGFKLTLEAVIGMTISTPAAFACLPEVSYFATYAGSITVVIYAEQDFNFRQSFFRAASSMHASQSSSGYDSPSAANTPETRSRQSPFQTSLQTPKRPGIGGDFAGSPGKGVARQPTRSATCISLSPDGQYLAMGEVGT